MVFWKPAEAHCRGRSRGRVQSSFWGCSGRLLYASSCAGLQWAGFISSAPRPVLVDLMWVRTKVWFRQEGLRACSSPAVYGGARAASVVHRMLSKLAGLCPRGASALEGVHIVEFIWIILIRELNYPSAPSHLKSSLSPQPHFCLPCYCCTTHSTCSRGCLLRPSGPAANFKPGTSAAASCPLPELGRGSY